MDLFDNVDSELPAPVQRHSPTSVEAGKRIDPVSGRMRRRVYEAIAGAGEYGMTDEEISLALQANPSGCRPRRIELQKMGMVVDSGRTRLTRSGRKAVVYVAVKNAVDDKKGLG